MSDEAPKYEIGDRVITAVTEKLKLDFQGLLGTVVEVGLNNGECSRIRFDAKENPTNAAGWVIRNTAFAHADPSDDEVARLFGLQQTPPSRDSTLVELLEHIDRALRSGKKTGRANLAFEFLLKSLDLTRLDLPSYVHDMQQE